MRLSLPRNVGSSHGVGQLPFARDHHVVGETGDRQAGCRGDTPPRAACTVEDASPPVHMGKYLRASGCTVFCGWRFLISASQIPLLLLAIGFDFAHFYHDWIAPRLVSPPQESPDFSYLASHCAHIPPISSDSFISRQDSLARTLHSLNAAAYIAEPSASAGFFANLSKSHWGLSERPLLLIIQPQTDEQGTVRANVSVLTPAFEQTRARMLPIPSDAGVTYTAWPEDVNPFATALALVPDLDEAVIYVDGDVRTFVTDGLQKAAPGAKVLNAPVEIKRLRERKSSEELDIMKCVNEVG